jgi:hypothetical protein
MVEPARIFVSHSSLDNDFTKELCTKLQSTSHQTIIDFDVLVDYQKLVSGKPWPTQLNHWMAKCHAGILLLTKNAVRSAWVLKEATILSWRLSEDPRFKLFTVRFPDVTNEMLTSEKFDPLNLGEVQQIAGQNAEDIARQVSESLGKIVATRTLFNKLAGRLSDLFAKVEDDTFSAVAEKTRVATPPWRPDRDPRRQHIDEVAERLLSSNLGDYEGIDELIDELSTTTSAETVGQILYLIASYWVDAEAAGKLPRLTSCNPRRAAAMNGAHVSKYTAQRYVERAHPISNWYRVIPTSGGSAGDLVKHYTTEICKYVRNRENRPDDSDEVIIEDLKGRKAAFYVVIEFADQESLDTLMSRFPKLTFILCTGDALPRDEGLHGVEWLTPPVDLKREHNELLAYVQAESIIRNMNQG